MKQIHSSQLHPTAKKDVVINEPGSGETIVYDLKTDKAHCLNPTASFVWNQCDGRTSVNEIAQRFSQTQQGPVDESVVLLALKQLDRAQLLQEPLAKEGKFDLSRRSTLRKIGVTVLLPTIVSLVAPTASAAVSCVQGDPCNASSPGQCGVNGTCVSGQCVCT